MKMFEDIKTVEKTEEPKSPTVVKDRFIKQNLLKSTTRTGEVYKLIEKWLYSWEGGMTKKVFAHQMKRLDWDDDIATSQLQRAIGKRVIPLPPPPKKPPLTKSLMEQMVEDTYVAVYGRKFRGVIKEAVKQLKECGEVYILEMEELILEFKGYEDKGKSPYMIDKAIGCDFLVVVDLEKPIHLEWHIAEAITRIGRKRMQAKKPIVSTWNRFNDCNEFFEAFKIYIVE